MNNGCSIDFVNADPEVDHVRILESVASVCLRRYIRVYPMLTMFPGHKVFTLPANCPRRPA
jgi:hypothetical protein